jgi:hypothetical protein
MKNNNFRTASSISKAKSLDFGRIRYKIRKKYFRLLQSYKDFVIIMKIRRLVCIGKSLIWKNSA